MSTIDTREEFEAWARGTAQFVTLKGAAPQGRPWYYFDDEAQDAWEVWQAATEAAKATSVAVGEPNWPEFPSVIFGMVDDAVIQLPKAHAVKLLREYGQQCAEAARQPAPVVAGCEFCGNAIGHDLDCQNHPVNAKAPFQQDDEHKAFLATYLDAARKASDNTSAEMILWHANRHWNGKAGEMWRARAALAATAAPVLMPEGVTIKAFQAAHDNAWHITIKHPFGESFVRMSNQRDIQLAELIAATRSQP